MTSKQRAYLRSLANPLQPIVYVGKGGMSDTIEKQADDALTARELIKGKVLETAPATARDIAEEIAAAVNAEVVQVVARTFVLFRQKMRWQSFSRLYPTLLRALHISTARKEAGTSHRFLQKLIQSG